VASGSGFALISDSDAKKARWLALPQVVIS